MVWGQLYSTCDFALKYYVTMYSLYPGKKICFLVVCCGPSMARFRNIDFDNVMLKCVCCVCCSTLESSSRPSPSRGWSCRDDPCMQLIPDPYGQDVWST